MSVQWVHLGADRLLVATDERAWLQRTELGSPGFLGPMNRRAHATVASTRNLLDGAFAAAERASAAAERAAPPSTARPMTAQRWVWQLIGQWYVAHHSVALLSPLIRRYAELGRDDLADFARRKLAEEGGHDQFPLADLRALGYDADRLVESLSPPPVAKALVRLAEDFVSGPDPVEFIGYVYALERDVIRVSEDRLLALAEALPGGVNAASGIRAHAMELDDEHVEDAIVFIASLTPADRTHVALACHRTITVREQASGPGLPSETELADVLSRFALKLTTRGAPQ